MMSLSTQVVMRQAWFDTCSEKPMFGGRGELQSYGCIGQVYEAEVLGKDLEALRTIIKDHY